MCFRFWSRKAVGFLHPEIWGFQKAHNIEKVHLDFCKSLLSFKQCTTNVMVYYELGRYPLIYQRVFNIIKYWFKILLSKNCILKNCYRYQLENLIENKASWVHQLRQLLFHLGLNDFWFNQDNLDLNKGTLLFIKERIYD